MLVDQPDHLSEEHVEAALALHQRMARHLVDEILRDNIFYEILRDSPRTLLQSRLISSCTVNFRAEIFVIKYLKTHPALLNELLLKDSCSISVS